MRIARSTSTARRHPVVVVVVVVGSAGRPRSGVECGGRRRRSRSGVVAAQELHDTPTPSDAARSTHSRRDHLRALVLSLSLSLSSTLALALPARPSHAIGFKKDMSKARRNTGVDKSAYLDLDISPYNVTETITTTTTTTTTTTADDGTPTPTTTTATTSRPLTSIKFYDILEGKGDPVAPGDPVTVHFDCIFRKIDAVSTRSARLLGGNRVIAEPFSFVAASQLDAPKTVTTDAGGGLFTGQSGPKAPQAVSYAVVGMKPGGKRSVFVPAVLGYGSKGEQEIPPNCPEFELEIELLSVGGEQ